MEVCEVLVTLMAIHTCIFELHAQFTRMWESFVFIRVAINAFKSAVVGMVKFRTVDNEIRIHPFFNILLYPIIVIIVFLVTMAFEARMVLLIIPCFHLLILRISIEGEE
jgi:hypothetical protein